VAVNVGLGVAFWVTDAAGVHPAVGTGDTNGVCVGVWLTGVAPELAVTVGVGVLLDKAVGVAEGVAEPETVAVARGVGVAGEDAGWHTSGT